MGSHPFATLIELATQYKPIIDAVAAMLTPVIGAAIVYIAWRQWRTAAMSTYSWRIPGGCRGANNSEGGTEPAGRSPKRRPHGPR
ncbi:MAG: hypothetical protein WBD34_02415 [Burkholderiaceae bacterium]